MGRELALEGRTFPGTARAVPEHTIILGSNGAILTSTLPELAPGLGLRAWLVRLGLEPSPVLSAVNGILSGQRGVVLSSPPAEVHLSPLTDGGVLLKVGPSADPLLREPWTGPIGAACLGPLFVLEAVRDSEGELFDFRLVAANDATAEFLACPRQQALSQLIGEVMPTLAFSDAFRVFSEATAKGRVDSTVEIRPGGQRRWIRLRAVALKDGVAVAGLDVTQDHQIAQRVGRTEVLEELTRLASGVAHDFNNALVAILNGAEEVALTLPEDAAVRADLADIQQAGRRAAALAHQFLALTGRQGFRAQAVDINESVKAMDKLLRRTMGEDVEIVLRCGDGLPRIQGGSGQVESMVLALAGQARGEMPTGGRLVLETRFEPTESAVILGVEDTGPGVPLGGLERQETGLGWVMDAARAMGGTVSAEGRPGQGTRVEVRLPVQLGQEHTPRDTAKPEPEYPRVVLVVEDDPVLRSIVRRMLRRLGFDVLVAESFDQAVDECTRVEGAIDLLLTDAVLPHASGIEVARVLIGRWPHVKCLFMSGYDREVLRRHGMPDDAPLLEKPFNISMLERELELMFGAL